MVTEGSSSTKALAMLVTNVQFDHGAGRRNMIVREQNVKGPISRRHNCREYDRRLWSKYVSDLHYCGNVVHR